MYLFRAPNSTYYTRICLPKSLRDKGFPFDLKISLLTKRRDEAVERNFILVPQIRSLIESASERLDANGFRRGVDETVNEIRQGFSLRDVSRLPTRIVRTESSLPKPILEQITTHQPPSHISPKTALEGFIESKKASQITPLSVEQLNQRITHFLEGLDLSCISKSSSADAVRFRDRLYCEGRSYKTNKEYIAACRQFFKWCKQMEYVADNPFGDIDVKHQVKKKSKDEERPRWTMEELRKFYGSTAFQSQSEQFKWTTALMLYHGLRPSEACQLRVGDIRKENGIDCIVISEEGEHQHVKTSSSIRVVPIHPRLIEEGFLEYVSARQVSKCAQLFDYKPEGKWCDWSRSYRRLFGIVQTTLGMVPKARPTAYSFRHTFTDELKQKGIEESLVAQIVGHSHQSMTFGRYGKKYPVKTLLKAIKQVRFPKIE